MRIKKGELGPKLEDSATLDFEFRCSNVLNPFSSYNTYIDPDQFKKRKTEQGSRLLVRTGRHTGT